MIERTLSTYLRRDAEYYPVVTVTGPRQSGKTTLVRNTFPDHRYVSLEETDLRRFAVDDPRGFLREYSEPVILDEVQRAPQLFSYIQTTVDQSPTPGRFVLSGSQNFILMESVSQSLAGRTGILHLLPFQRAEIEPASGADESGADGPAAIFSNRSTTLDLWETVFRGFYPRVRVHDIPPEVWYADYLRSYVERDVRKAVQIGDLDRFERFLALVAGRVGQLLNYSSLANDAGISVDTARRWLSVLKAAFVVFLLPPHHRNLNKRLIRTPKLYLYDTGVACSLLGIRTADQIRNHPLRGALFENLVVAELAKHFEHHRMQPPMFFWRDQTGHEVDVLIENAGKVLPVEIKSGATVQPDMFKGLHWWCEAAGQELSTATLVHGGDATYTRNDVTVRPWYAI
jgi:uncharacterized protein